MFRCKLAKVLIIVVIFGYINVDLIRCSEETSDVQEVDMAASETESPTSGTESAASETESVESETSSIDSDDSACPSGFIQLCPCNSPQAGCYFIQPADSTFAARTNAQAQAACQALHPNSQLVSLETVEEFKCISGRIHTLFGAGTTLPISFWTGAIRNAATGAETWQATGTPYTLNTDISGDASVLLPTNDCGRLRFRNADRRVVHTGQNCNFGGTMFMVGYVCEIQP